MKTLHRCQKNIGRKHYSDRCRTTRQRERLKDYLFYQQDGKCCYYGHSFEKEILTLEHIQRKTDGGSTRWDNMALSCAPCNSGRQDWNWFAYKSYKMGEISFKEMEKY